MKKGPRRTDRRKNDKAPQRRPTLAAVAVAAVVLAQAAGVRHASQLRLELALVLLLRITRRAAVLARERACGEVLEVEGKG